MSSSELVFERPWLLLLLIPAILLIVLPFLFLPKKQKSTFRKIAPLVLHILIATILVLLIAGMQIRTSTTDAASILLIDLSDSASGFRDLIELDAEEVFESMQGKMPVGVMAFADDQVYSVNIGSNGKFALGEVKSDATNIEAALKKAADALPDDKAGRIVLFGDGRQTDGDALKEAKILANEGIRIDTVYFDSGKQTKKEVQITSLSAPQKLFFGEKLELTVVIDSTDAGSVGMVITDGLIPVHNETLKIEEGNNSFVFELSPEEQGVHTYTVTITSDNDSLKENNARSLCVEVGGRANILLLSGALSRGTFVYTTLSKEYNVKRSVAHAAPKSIIELCKYDQVVLVDVNADDLPEDFADMLESYVSIYGRSVVMIGGGDTFSLGNMQGSKYEELMPVSLEYQKSETDKAVALALVIDCSRSMSMNGSNNLSLAKQGAIKCMEALSDADSVAVVSFNGKPKLEHELVKATYENKTELKRVISAIASDAGTQYTAALTTAFAELVDCDAPLKHVIFLSDGQPFDEGYIEAAMEMSEAGITISTIGLDFYSDALPEIAKVANGRYYSVGSATDLPDIMLSEARLVATSSLVTGVFNVSIPEKTPVSEEIAEGDLPSLTGYIGSTPREDATLAMTVGENDPLVAYRDFGKGQVLAFMSDLSGEWTDGWYTNQKCAQLIKQMSATVLTPNSSSSALALTAEQKGKTAVVTLETDLSIADKAVTLTCAYQKKSEDHILYTVGRGLYQAEIPTDTVGVYEFTAKLYDDVGRIVDFATLAHAVSYSDEYDLFAASGRQLLEDVSAAAGGECVTYGTTEKDLVNAEERSVSFIKELFVPFAIAAFVLYLVDVAIRRVRLKDLKIFLETIFSKRSKKNKVDE